MMLAHNTFQSGAEIQNVLNCANALRIICPQPITEGEIVDQGQPLAQPGELWDGPQGVAFIRRFYRNTLIYNSFRLKREVKEA
jgi:hypothetical protein